MKNVKIVANYLPQFHEIPENNRWWGKGYTDWAAVQRAKPLYESHRQPRVPQNGYYRLDEKDAIAWQAKIARDNGVDIFGIYHYWFSSQMKLLEKPAEILLASPEIDIDYMFIWDNSTWRRTWSNIKHGNDWAPEFERAGEATTESRGILAELVYGNEDDWTAHFEYLLPFFQDKRYVKVDNCPVFCFFNPDNDSETLKKMCAWWSELAKKYGFSGVRVIEQRKYLGDHMSEYGFTYEPPYHGWYRRNFTDRVVKKIRQEILLKLKKPLVCSYDRIWKKIIRFADSCKDDKLYYGAFVSYDDTPRRGSKGTIVVGESPEKFMKYMKRLVEIADRQKKDFIFLTAWNEWGEGAYMEPDTEMKSAYLEALRKAVKG